MNSYVFKSWNPFVITLVIHFMNGMYHILEYMLPYIFVYVR